MPENKMVTISLDCMGGDNAPEAIIEGAFLASKEFKDKIKFILFGREDSINKVINGRKFDSEIEIINSDMVISSDEKPSIALRRGRGSSMGMAIESVKEKKADACVSAGNTGALMALSKLILRTLPDIDRPALIQLLPNNKGGCTALLDMGANSECDSTNLCQFAIMGSAFISSITGNQNPKIALLNIGSEDIKGNDSIKRSANVLKNSKIGENFAGYIEGDDILTGKVDVIVTDGFTGNIALKSVEGVCKVLGGFAKDIFKSSILSKISYLLIRGKVNKLKKKLTPDNYNGAILIGLNGISIKSHGNATPTSFYYAIKNTYNLVINDLNSKIIEHVRELEIQE